MVKGIIKKDGKDNYISLNNDSKRYYFFCDEEKKNMNILEYKDGNFKVMDKDKTFKIYETVFPKHDIFVKEENGKRFYLDLNANYRVFNSDGYEDIDSFFSINNNRKIIIRPKLAKVSHSLYQCLNVKSVAFILALELAIMIPLLKADKDLFLQKYYESRPLMSTEQVIDEIYDSWDVDLNKELKDYLANEDFISDVLSFSDQDRNYMLHKKLHNIQLVYEEEACLARGEHVGGFYNPCKPNTMCLKEDSKKVIDSCLAHEFVHLLQDNNKYSYIIEACAEIMAAEYFDEGARAYFPLRQRVGVLMEILGSDIVMECNFKGDTTSFENTIIKYLGKEDGTRLLKCFASFESSMTDEKLDELNDDIDKYLAKMYQNVYDKDISSDEVITSIYENGPILDRYYFNKHSENYSKDNYIYGEDYKSLEVDLDEMLNSKMFNYYRAIEFKTITEEEYNKNDQARVYLNLDGKPQPVSKEYYEYLKDNNLDSGVEVIKYYEEVYHDPASIKSLDKVLNNEDVQEISLQNVQDRNLCIITREDDNLHCLLYYSKKVPSFDSKFKSKNKFKTINN